MTTCEALPAGSAKHKEIFGEDREEMRGGGGSDTENQPSAAVDPRLPLSRLQAFKLRQSWKCVRRDLEQTALDALIRMLRKNSNYSALVGLSPDKIGSGEFETMSMKLFAAVDECMNRAAESDISGIIQHAVEVRSDAPFNEVGLIKDYEQPVLSAIKQTLGDRYSDAMDTIYTMVLKFFIETIHTGHV